MAAVRVLKSRVLMGNPPDVAQLIGTSLTDWNNLGLVMPLNAVATHQKWSQNLSPTVMQLISKKGNVIAAPLGIHRINTLLYNRHIFERWGLTPPTNWEEFELLAQKLRAQGIRPLAWSDEAWQIATVFESVLLGEVGPTRYKELIVARNGAAWLGADVEKALNRLRWLRDTNREPPSERNWTDATRDVYSDTAAMVIMGDWAKGELMAWGASPDKDFGCSAVPNTSKMHLYSIDTLAILRNDNQHTDTKEKLAELLVSPTIQWAYNRTKGSVSVRSDIDSQSLDACARDSWTVFNTPGNSLVPSLTHRMAGNEAIKDAVAQALWRFLITPEMSAKTTQLKLAAAVRAP